VAFTIAACSDAEEAPRVRLTVEVDSSGLVQVETDLGYRVDVTQARVVVEDFAFTIAGEAHVKLWQRVSDALISVAHAHPGHFQGGEVTGEMPGRFVLDFAPGGSAPLGTATLLAGRYESVNFTLAVAGAADGVAPDDSLTGHTALLTGVASKDDESVAFDVLLDSPEGRQLVGAPFDHVVTESSAEVLGIRFNVRDPLESDTLFDGVDFAALDGDHDGSVLVEPTSPDDGTLGAYDLIHRRFQTHDHFDVRPRPAARD
jgi:hypothetical protein